MGIKFRCPNGHKLNVKAFLAGKRGICPKCGVRFVIPRTSHDQVATLDQGLPIADAIDRESTDPGPETPSPVALAPLPTPPEKARAAPRFSPIGSPAMASPGPRALHHASTPAPIDPLTEAPDALWYVRPASGGQFGPATTNVFQQWIDEGRIAGDSFVWRDGWDHWQQAGAVFPQLGNAGDLLSRVHPPLPSFSVQNTIGYHKSGRRKSKKSAWMLTVILFLAVILLLVVLLFVFWYQGG
ncbi:MAG: DUF4339 domain-containing protein [Pirellulales bacterium]|nr:DUF4339 domain-containing protein [Pirellulales bacterium]